VKRFLYLIGAPGAGKTTLIEKCLEGIPFTYEPKPFAVRYYPKFGPGAGCQLGSARKAFGGTDTLSMSVQPKVVDWLACGFSNWIVAEGDRLGNDKFFSTLLQEGWELTVVCLNTPPGLTLQRCAQRGSDQNVEWMNGRRTKVEKLTAKYCTDQWILDGRLTVDELVSTLCEHPVISHIRNR
jgi:GTPase SAR1 family protein